MLSKGSMIVGSVSILAMFLFQVEAAADVVTMKSGRTLEGKVQHVPAAEAGQDETDASAASNGTPPTVVLQTRYGSVELDHAEIASIVYSETIEEKVEKTLGELDSKEIEIADRLPRYMELARECSESGWKTMHRDILLHVLSLEAEYLPAREALGYTKSGGHWMTEDEIQVSKGLVKYKGKWVHPDEVEAREAANYWKKTQNKVNKLTRKMGSRVAANREKAYEQLVEMKAKVPGIVQGADALRDYYDRYYRALAARGEVVAEIRATVATLQRPMQSFRTTLATGSVFSGATEVQIQIPEISVTSVKTTVAIPTVEEDEDE